MEILTDRDARIGEHREAAWETNGRIQRWLCAQRDLIDLEKRVRWAREEYGTVHAELEKQPVNSVERQFLLVMNEQPWQTDGNSDL